MTCAIGRVKFNKSRPRQDGVMMKVQFRYTLSICMLGATMVIAGCATPYQSSGATGGYRDRKIDD